MKCPHAVVMTYDDHAPFRIGTIFAPAAGGAPTSVANVDSWSPVDAWTKFCRYSSWGGVTSSAAALAAQAPAQGWGQQADARQGTQADAYHDARGFPPRSQEPASSLIPGSRTAGSARGAVSPNRLVFSLSCAAALSPGLQSYMMRRPQDARCKQ